MVIRKNKMEFLQKLENQLEKSGPKGEHFEEKDIEKSIDLQKKLKMIELQLLLKMYNCQSNKDQYIGAFLIM